MKKILLLITTVFVTTLQVQAESVDVTKFSIIRSGGGQIHLDVTKGAQHRCAAGRSTTGLCTSVIVELKSCNFQEQSEKSFVMTSSSVYTPPEALAILNNTAILAQNETPENPYLLGGTWSSLKVTFNYPNLNGTIAQKEITITKPLVLIEGKLSTVLSDIEDQARQKFEEFCN